MTVGSTAFVFPAFEMKYASYDIRQLEGVVDLFGEALARLGRASSLGVDRVIAAYGAAERYAGLTDEEKHHLCYIGSCVLADYVRRRGMTPNWIGPYSMGLFAALYAARCVSFEEGFALMNHVCQTAHQVGRHRQGYGMGSVVGLSRRRIEEIVRACGGEVFLSDEMSDKVVILSGKRVELDRVLEKARADGAFQGKMLNVELPYHSEIMQEAEDLIASFANRLCFKDPECPIVACTDQKILRTAEEVRREVCVNVLRPLNWKRTVEVLVERGVNRFVECGFCENLSKLLKMSAKHVEVWHPKRFHKLGVRKSAPSSMAGAEAFSASENAFEC
uniref:[acyl-carrier-protein] S-malonyltransferase n=1 Tax=Desulfacinum infernum TaxID=35837 RepID=A0A832EEM6_9BACT